MHSPPAWSITLGRQKKGITKITLFTVWKPDLPLGWVKEAYQFKRLLTGKWKVFPSMLIAEQDQVIGEDQLTCIQCVFSCCCCLFFRSRKEKQVWARQKGSLRNELILQVTGEDLKGPTNTSQVQWGYHLACSPPATSTSFQLLFCDWSKWVGEKADFQLYVRWIVDLLQ